MQTVIAENFIPGDEIKSVDCVKIILLSVVLAGLNFYLQGWIGLNTADEGFLWYGAIETTLGKIPIRDFQSYDPGRYYWAAAWSFIFGDGIVALRLSSAIFLSIGLSLGLLAARRVIKSFPLLAAAGILFTVWMYPVFHYMDLSMALATVFFAVRLIERPTLLRHFSSGVFVGVAAFFGSNFGLYALLAFSALTLLIWFKADRKDIFRRFALLTAGITAGYSPMLLMFLFVPGFFSGYLNHFIIPIFKIGTNLPLPVPWPWIHDYSSVNMVGNVSAFFLGCWFLIMPLFYLAASISILFTGRDKIKKSALFIASVFVGVFYMHYAFSRADINHLARAIHPLLLAFLSLPVAFAFCRKKAFLAVAGALVLTMTLFTIVLKQPFVRKNVLKDSLYVQYNIRGDRVWIPEGVAKNINAFEKNVYEKMGPDDNVFFVPYIPALYCLFKKESPTWQTYLIFPASTEEQQEMVKKLETKNVKWAIIGLSPMDGREDLGFTKTHYIVWRYLLTEFTIADPLSNIPGYLLLRRREA